MELYPEDLGQQFTEMFVKQTENVSLLLSLLQVRWLFLFSLRLSTLLLMQLNRLCSEVQWIIMEQASIWACCRLSCGHTPSQ